MPGLEVLQHTIEIISALAMSIPLLVPKSARIEAKRLGALWSPEERAWMWPDDARRDIIQGWLPRIYKPGARPPHILPKMIPASMFGVNLRSLAPEQWKTISRQFRDYFGNRCQVCGRGRAHCHEDWEYIFNPSAWPKEGVQRLRRLACLCEQCHELKHLGKAEVDGRTETAMKHLAFINGWCLEQAYEEANRAWADWESRNEFRWRLDLSFAEQKYGLQIDATPERLAAIQIAAKKRFAPPALAVDPEPSEAELPAIAHTPLCSHHAHIQHKTVPWAAEPVRSAWTGGANSTAEPGCLALFGVALLGGIAGSLLLVMSPSARRIIVGPWPMTFVIVALTTLGFALLLVSSRPRRLLVIIALLGATGLYLSGVFHPNRNGTHAAQKRVGARAASPQKFVNH